ncbi:MAG: hypothetical protein J5J06_02870 [Phycisphaerae bacterium]|nr:hypothetical protein [Phycisphaerae bacterium]
MDAVEWVLIEGALAVRWLGGAIAWLAERAWGGFDQVANPLLSPIVGFVNPVTTTIGDAVYAVLGWIPAWAGLVILSVIVGVVMVPLFGRLSNQAGIARAKDAIKANLLALKLYRDELHVTFRSQWRILKAIGRLQWHVLMPILILLFPMLLVLAQMGVHYQWRAVRPGEVVQVRMKVDEARLGDRPVVLKAGPGFAVEVGPVPGGGEMWWRLRAEEAGRCNLDFAVGPLTIRKELVVGEGIRQVSAVRPGASWTARLLHPVERPLPAKSGVEEIEVLYPANPSWIAGSNVWVVTFFVVSMAAALIAAPVFGVKF